MTIIGLENCKSCIDFKDLHPELRFIELPRNSKHVVGDLLKVKKLIGKSKLNYFPILASDKLDNILSIRIFDPSFYIKHSKLY